MVERLQCSRCLTFGDRMWLHVFGFTSLCDKCLKELDGE